MILTTTVQVTVQGEPQPTILEPLFVNFPWLVQDETVISDKTFGEIYQAFISNRAIIFNGEISSGVYTLFTHPIKVLNCETFDDSGITKYRVTALNLSGGGSAFIYAEGEANDYIILTWAYLFVENSVENFNGVIDMIRFWDA